MKNLLWNLKYGGQMLIRNDRNILVATLQGYGDGTMAAWIAGSGLTSQQEPVTATAVRRLLKWIDAEI